MPRLSERTGSSARAPIADRLEQLLHPLARDPVKPRVVVEVLAPA